MSLNFFSIRRARREGLLANAADGANTPRKISGLNRLRLLLSRQRSPSEDRGSSLNPASDGQSIGGGSQESSGHEILSSVHRLPQQSLMRSMMSIRRPSNIRDSESKSFDLDTSRDV